MHWPNAETRERWEFVFKGVQALAIVVAAGWGLYTYGITAAQQRDAVKRELRRPYDKKQLDLYLDAARVLAHLGTSQDQKPVYEARFLELYWGELPFVESAEVRKRMVDFCREYFGEAEASAKCGNKPPNQQVTGADKIPPSKKVEAAKRMSETASCQIRSRWSAPDCLISSDDREGAASD